MTIIGLVAKGLGINSGPLIYIKSDVSGPPVDTEFTQLGVQNVTDGLECINTIENIRYIRVGGGWVTENIRTGGVFSTGNITGSIITGSILASGIYSSGNITGSIITGSSILTSGIYSSGNITGSSLILRTGSSIFFTSGSSSAAILGWWNNNQTAYYKSLNSPQQLTIFRLFQGDSGSASSVFEVHATPLEPNAATPANFSRVSITANPVASTPFHVIGSDAGGTGSQLPLSFAYGQTQVFQISGSNLIINSGSNIIIRSGSITPFAMPASYVVFSGSVSGVTGPYYAINGNNNNIDFSGVDAATVISGSINALTSGGQLFFRNGTYPLTKAISITKNNIAIIGENRESTILKSNSASIAWVINVNSTSGSTLRNFRLAHITLDATNGTSGSYGTFGTTDQTGSPGNLNSSNTYPLQYASIDDCAFINAKTSQSNSFQAYLQNSIIRGCRFKTAQSSHIFMTGTDVTIEGCTFEDWLGGSAITITPASTPTVRPSYFSIVGCTMDNTINSTQGLAAEISNADYTTVTSCTVKSGSTGIQFDSVSSTIGGTGNSVISCEISVANSGIVLNANGQTSQFKNGLIIGNNINGGSQAIAVGGYQGVTVEGNVCTGQTGSLTRAGGVTVSGLQIATNGATGSATTTNRIIVKGNMFLNGTSGSAIVFETLGASSSYNIDDVTIEGNNLQGNTGTIITNDGIGSVTNLVIRNNPPYNPVGYITPDIVWTGSPFTHKNTDSVSEDAFVYSGSITSITGSGGITLLTGSYHLEPAQSVVIATGSSAILPVIKRIGY